MADFPRKAYSDEQINRAGKLLGQTIFHDGTAIADDVIEAFNVAHNWRIAHGYPMYRERIRLSRYCGAGLTAGRIKAMASIRQKLRRSSLKLRKIQDFAGIRAILPDMAHVHEVAQKYTAGDRAALVRKTNDYISRPKIGGYRSFHIITSFQETGQGEHYTGFNVEIQLRTKLQHVWATAVEAVGAMRGEDLKAGEGDKNWLRLLELMSSYLARVEGEQLSEHVPQTEKELLAEIAELEGAVSAVANLSTFRDAVDLSDSWQGSNSSFFVITLDAKRGTVKVEPQRSFSTGADGYGDLSQQLGSSQQVLVSVDKIEALKAAYPNYFLDVTEFLEHLMAACNIKGIAPQPKPVINSIDSLDLSFLKKIDVPKKPRRDIHLHHSGFVYWGGDQVGLWQRSTFGTYYFEPSRFNHFVAIEDDLAEFTEQIRLWLER